MHKSLTGCRNFTGPWVTGVGGTKQQKTNSDQEVANSFSGGGFSAYFSRHYYQEDPVTNYLGKLGSQHAGYYKCVRPRDLTQPILTM